MKTITPLMTASLDCRMITVPMPEFIPQRDCSFNSLLTGVTAQIKLGVWHYRDTNYHIVTHSPNMGLQIELFRSPVDANKFFDQILNLYAKDGNWSEPQHLGEQNG